MANYIDEFLVKIGFDVNKKSENAVNKSIAGIEKTVESLSNTISGIQGAIGTIAAAWAGSKLVSYITDAADKFDALGNAAKRIGTDSPEDLAALQFAFEQAGVSADLLTDGLGNLTDIIGQARLGEGEGLEVFQKLGIQINDANGKARDTVSIFNDVSSAMSNLDHATQVAYINMLGLDTELIQGMSMQQDELNDLKKGYLDAYAAAGVSINESVKNAQTFNGALNQLKNIFSVITDAIGVKFLGMGAQVFDQVRKYALDNIGKIVGILQSLLKVILSVGKAFTRMARIILDAVIGVIDWWDKANTTLKTVITTIGGITAAVYLLNTAFMKSPLGRLLALATAVALLIDDFLVWKEGGDSLIGSFIGGFDDVMKSLDEFPKSISWIGEALKKIVPNIDYVLGGLLGIPLALKTTGPVLGIVKSGFFGLSKVIAGLSLILGKTLIKSFIAFSKIASTAFLGLIKTVGLLSMSIIKLTTTAMAGLIRALSMAALSMGKLITGAMVGLIKMIGVLTLSLIKLGLAFLATPVGWIVAGIAAIIAAGVLLYKNWDTVTKFLTESWEWATGKLSEGFEFVKSGFSSFGDFASGITSAISDVWSSFFDWIAQKFKWFSDIVNSVRDKAKGFMKSIGLGDDDDEKNNQTTDDQTTYDKTSDDSISRNAPPAKQLTYKVAEFSEATKQKMAQFAPANYSPVSLVRDDAVVNNAPVLTSYPVGNGLATAEKNANNNFTMAASANRLPLMQSNTTGDTITQNNNGDTIINVTGVTEPQQTAQAIAQKQVEIAQMTSRNFRRSIM